MCLCARSSGNEIIPNTLFRKNTKGARIEGNAKQMTMQMNVYCHKLLSTSFDIAPTVVVAVGVELAIDGTLGNDGVSEPHEDNKRTETLKT